MNDPIWTRIGCNADALTELINQGMNLTQRSSFFNETVLHNYAGGVFLWSVDLNDAGISYQELSLKVVKILINSGADLLALDSWGFTPLLLAANGRYRGHPNLKVLDFLLEREEYSRAEKIEAMELAGAVILQNVKNSSLFHKAFHYWRKTLQLRHLMEVDDSGFIGKSRLNLKKTQITEWVTSEELEDVIEHQDKFLIQSFLVRLRIFSSKSRDIIDILMDASLLYDYIWKLQQQCKFVDIFDIIWAMLETLLSRSDKSKIGLKTARIFEKLIEVFSCIYKDSSKIFTEEIINKSLYFIASATELGFPIFYCLIPFVRILSNLPQFSLAKFSTDCLSKVRDQFGRNLLHQAIIVGTCDTNLYATVRILLNAGCDSNAIDRNGNTPLHFLPLIDERDWFGDLNIIAFLLLDFGAQLSLKNSYGKTAVDLWKQKNCTTRNMDVDQGIID